MVYRDAPHMENDMFRFAAVLAFALLPASAFAGCVNYTDGSTSQPAPKVVICYQGQCSETLKSYECGNVTDALFGYQNGWKFAFKANSDEVWAKMPNGTELDSLDGIACYEGSGEFGCPGLLTSEGFKPSERSMTPADTEARVALYTYPKDAPNKQRLPAQPDLSRVPLPVPRPRF